VEGGGGGGGGGGGQKKNRPHLAGAYEKGTDFQKTGVKGEACFTFKLPLRSTVEKP